MIKVCWDTSEVERIYGRSRLVQFSVIEKSSRFDPWDNLNDPSKI